MNRRIEVFSSVLLLALAIIIAVGLWQWVNVGKQIEAIHEEDARRVIGQDENLAEAVRTLEETLKERIDYQFDLNVDPLDLTRVISHPVLLEKLGLDELETNKEDMRLAATITTQNGEDAIIIRFMGSNHVLRVGDQIAGWKVKAIGRKEATLVRGGYSRKLKNKRANEYEGLGLDLSVPEYTGPLSSGNSGNN